ncbi:MAG: sugar kinase [Actinomycetota bacterium]|nr:sugar kinase [Actinomycetota bacterium]
MTRVVCLGDLMMDVLARLPGPLAVGSDTPAPVGIYGGGSAANTAAWLVRAGLATTFVGRVGDDALGRRALEELRAAGVELAVSIDPVRPTGTCIVLVDVDGERTMVPSAGANAGLGDVGLPAELFGPSSYLHLSGYALFTAGSRPAALEALALAHSAGCPISVDTASAAPLAGVGPDLFQSWVGTGVLVFANRDEATVLTGTADPGAAARILGQRCGEAIVKCGADAAVWSDGGDVIEVPVAASVAIDSTGAGDAFAAGVLAARVSGGDVRTTLRAGHALAARAISHVGGRPQA